MRWIRDHARQGSWLALFALVVNLGLSFGHIHAIDGKRAERGFASLLAAVTAPDDGQAQRLGQSQGPNQGHRDDGLVDLLCPICMAASAMGQAFAAAAPALALALVETTVVPTTICDLVVPEPPRAAFDPRGPPIS
jgi:hypothetical protein